MQEVIFVPNRKYYEWHIIQTKGTASNKVRKPLYYCRDDLNIKHQSTIVT